MCRHGTRTTAEHPRLSAFVRVPFPLREEDERVTDAWGNLYTDRRRLTTQAYADSKNLDARASIYRYQQPYVDLIGWTLEQMGAAHRHQHREVLPLDVAR